MGRIGYETETLIPTGHGGFFDDAECPVAIPIQHPNTGLSGIDLERKGCGIGEDGDPAFTLRSGQVDGVAFTQNQSGDVLTGSICAALSTNQNASGRNSRKVQTGMAVRRLTPTECERLQGFPDGWTAIPWRGKPAHECPDGPRYRAIGNSMAVPVIKWIGQRIEGISKII